MAAAGGREFSRQPPKTFHAEGGRWNACLANFTSLFSIIGLRCRYGFNPNRLCQPGADGHARIADQADDIRLTGNELDDLFLAEADLAESVRHFGRGAKLFDADRHTCLDPIQGTQGTIVFILPLGNRFTDELHAPNNLSVHRAGHYSFSANCCTDFAL